MRTNRDSVPCMRLFLLTIIAVLAGCSYEPFNTNQTIRVELIGTDSAFCTLSSLSHKYQLYAPGTVRVEQTSEDLKVDCRDNLSDRRRVVDLLADIKGVYYAYAPVVTVDFASLDNGNRLNGFRTVNRETSQPIALTEDSFSAPVSTDQTYPVQKTYATNRRSYPVDLEIRTPQPLVQQNSSALTPLLQGLLDPSAQ